jgi:hypothetical protein
VFLGVVVFVFLLAALLSVMMARLSTNRSVIGNILLAMAGVAALGVGLLLLMTALTSL